MNILFVHQATIYSQVRDFCLQESATVSPPLQGCQKKTHLPYSASKKLLLPAIKGNTDTCWIVTAKVWEYILLHKFCDGSNLREEQS